MIPYTPMSDATVPTVNDRVTLPAWPAWAPLAVLAVSAFWISNSLRPWLVMLVIFFGLYAGFKWQAFWSALRSGIRPSFSRAFGYFFLSAGVDAHVFLDDRGPVPAKPMPREWLAASVKTALGVILTYFVASRVHAGQPYLGAGLGLAGCVLMAHFGGFHLLALAWRRAGVNAQFVMRKPLLADSLSDLWGSRWNLPFRDMMHRLVLRPLSAPAGSTTAMFAVFLVSGLLHEMVISVPARGGYGLPTAYFLLQACGVLLERSRPGRRMGLRNGWRGWLFAFLVAVLPAVLLLNPPFIFQVGVPLLTWMGAL